MYKTLLFLIFLFFSSSLYGKFDVSFYKDKNLSSNINEVLNKEFTLTKSKKSLGRLKKVWLKVSIDNDYYKAKENYLSLTNIHIMEDVHFYTVVNAEVIKKDLAFNKYTNHDIESKIGNSLLYKNQIEANSKIDVYIYITAKSNIYYEINSGDLSDVVSSLSKSTIVLILMVGALIALGIYYGFLYILTPNKSYLYYTLFVFSLSFWGFYIYGGFAYYFGIFNIGAFSNSFILLMPMFTILFLKSIYKDLIEFKIYSKILDFVLFVFFIAMVLYITGNLGITTYYSIAKYGALLYLFSFIVILSIALIIYRKKFIYSGLFLIGFSVNFIGSMVSILFFFGKTSYNIFTFHANMIGGLLEAILFSILLTYTIRQVYKEKDKALNVAKLQDLKINIMGETIDFISHQWRQPLSQINGSVMALDSIALKHDIKSEKFYDELSDIENVTSYMSRTIDDFKNLFSKNKNDEIIVLNDVINNTLNIMEKTLNNSHIKVELNIKNKITINANKGDIIQILLVLLNNAKDAILENKIENGKINIFLDSKEDIITLKVSDNAGGIKEDKKAKIFEAYYTTKQKTFGSGLGLYIAKIIVESKMKGTLNIKNENDGACFIIILPKS